MKTPVLPGGLTAMAWLPTDPPRPCPEVLTADEAVMYLRLNSGRSIERGKRAFRRYREQGRITGCRVGKQIVFRRVDLDRFVEEQREKVSAPHCPD